MVRINLLGTSFRVDSDKSEEYLNEVVEHYARRVLEIESSMKNKDPLKKAILAGLLVSDEFLQQRRRIRTNPDADEIKTMEEITTRLIREIDASL